MIFYFSGTGNTRWAAQRLAEATGDELHNIPDELRTGDNHYMLKEGERLGFCFPTHGWQPPRLVRDFIRRSTFSNVSYCYALTTCGDNMGQAMDILNGELRKKGFSATAVFSLVMPESYVCLPLMYTDSEERELEKKARARELLESTVIPVITEKQQGVEMLEKGATPRLYSHVIGQYFNRRMITDKKFHVDEDVCTHCGRCAKVCPVDNITGTPPVWLHNGRCTCCLACYHYCPVHAINYGERTRQRDQYYFNRREARKS